jgi:hypothetical protein
VFFKPNPRRIALTVIFILLSLLYTRKEGELPFKTEWIWHDQPIYHSSSPITHIGFPWSYLSKGEYQATGKYKPGFAFLGCDSKTCVFDLPGQKRVFLYYFNVLLNLIFWYFIAWLAIFIFGKFKKGAHGAVG